MSRVRNERLYVQLTKEEKDIIKNKMSKVRMTNLGEFVRKALVEGNFIYIDTNGIDNLAYEINKIGVNINQITKLANTAGSVSKSDIEALNKKMDILNNFIADIYSRLGKGS